MTEPGALPKYLAISEHLIREIGAGRLPEGSLLPPERELAVSLGIAVGTLRRALAQLETQGLLERRQGSGNRVKAASQATGIYSFFRLELLGGGGLPTARLLSFAHHASPPDTPFGPQGAWQIRRLRALDQTPVALEEIWLSAAALPDLAREDLGEALYRSYRLKGLWITRANDSIGILEPPDWTPEALGLIPGQPTGFIRREATERNGEIVEVSNTWFNAQRARYISRLR